MEAFCLPGHHLGSSGLQIQPPIVLISTPAVPQSVVGQTRLTLTQFP